MIDAAWFRNVRIIPELFPIFATRFCRTGRLILARCAGQILGDLQIFFMGSRAHFFRLMGFEALQ